MKHIVTLPHLDDAYSFYVGQELVLDNTSGRLRPQTRGERLKARLKALLWWRQPRGQVTEVDAEAGVVTLRAQRWSWLHWGWR